MQQISNLRKMRSVLPGWANVQCVAGRCRVEGVWVPDHSKGWGMGVRKQTESTHGSSEGQCVGGGLACEEIPTLPAASVPLAGVDVGKMRTEWRWQRCLQWRECVLRWQGQQW